MPETIAIEKNWNRLLFIDGMRMQHVRNNGVTFQPNNKFLENN